MIQAIKRIISQLYKDTNIRVVQANQTAPKPASPYGVYNITSPYIKGVGHENITYYDDNGELYQKHTEQYRVTLSFNLYAATNETTIDLAMRVRLWFLFFAQEFIEEQNITVIEVGNIENRTTFLVDSYEYKHGFDVQVRLTDEQSRVIDWFNNIEIKRGE
ncbi:hypothetical protein AMS60_05615 [Bacillus sp. FJAT-21945]|nr:hypothetical protein AMS60_05615 [Bacillus sp. FJAT-21945]